MEYKRKTREVPQEVRDKISASLKGVKKTPEHCRNIKPKQVVIGATSQNPMMIHIVIKKGSGKGTQFCVSQFCARNLID